MGDETVIRAEAPGRICLVGEHCDYGKGIVVAVPLAERIVGYGERHDMESIACYSILEGKGFSGCWNGALPEKGRLQPLTSLEYALGVASSCGMQGIRVPGATFTLRGNLLMDVGLGSSAALSVCLTQLYCALADHSAEPDEIARLSYVALHDFLGIPCGKMDPIVSAYRGAMSIDFSSGEPVVTSLNHHTTGAQFVVCIPRGTRMHSRTILQQMRHSYENGKSAEEQRFQEALDRLVPENVVRPFIDAFQKGDLISMGRLMRLNQQIYDRQFVPICEDLEAGLLYEGLQISRAHGSLGEKWLGAGGLGTFLCLFADSTSAQRVKEVLLKKYSVPIEFLQVSL